LQTRRDESLNESSRRVFAGVHRAGGEGVDFERARSPTVAGVTNLSIAATAERARLELLEEHRRHVLHDLEHLNDCLGAINFKIDRYRGSTT
jgi:hypothetical protein